MLRSWLASSSWPGRWPQGVFLYCRGGTAGQRQAVGNRSHCHWRFTWSWVLGVVGNHAPFPQFFMNPLPTVGPGPPAQAPPVRRPREGLEGLGGCVALALAFVHLFESKLVVASALPLFASESLPAKQLSRATVGLGLRIVLCDRNPLLCRKGAQAREPGLGQVRNTCARVAICQVEPDRFPKHILMLRFVCSQCEVTGGRCEKEPKPNALSTSCNVH